ncbi:MAG: class I SAM-dependent DNA methyltransferase [Egibacteraceae bacterium]
MARSRWNPSRDPQDYDRTWDDLAARGENVHGEADFVEALGVRSVLDAGCGTGRVAIELARRGLDVVGVDLDPQMLAAARQKAPQLRWVEADLATVPLDRFEAVVLAGNVMIFLAPGTEGAVVENLAGHLQPGGLLVSGFQLVPGRLTLKEYDAMATAAGLELAGRWATWDKQRYQGGDYAVCLHRRPARFA